MTREEIAAAANRLAQASRNPGAPTLTPNSDRLALTRWLQWNDPNGCHTDELALAELFDPYTDDDAWEILGAVVSEEV